MAEELVGKNTAKLSCQQFWENSIGFLLGDSLLDKDFQETNSELLETGIVFSHNGFSDVSFRKLELALSFESKGLSSYVPVCISLSISSCIYSSLVLWDVSFGRKQRVEQFNFTLWPLCTVSLSGTVPISPTILPDLKSKLPSIIAS